MGGRHDESDEPTHHEFADFVPDEFDAIPPHASTETKWLYLFATGAQLGQLAVSVWGLNRLSRPDLGTGDKIFAGVVVIIAIVVAVRAWSAAYHSAADDKYRERLRRPDLPD